MKNTIVIEPADPEMEIFASAVSILNEFKLLGFNTRRDFIEIVSSHLPKYSTYSHIEKLRGFWQARVKDEQLNSDLKSVINKIRRVA